jgi:hypothetical protein
MMEKVSTSETSENFYEITPRNIPEDSYPYINTVCECVDKIFAAIFYYVNRRLPRKTKIKIKMSPNLRGKEQVSGSSSLELNSFQLNYVSLYI